METAKLTSKGQLVIPKNVREALHLRPGTSFAVTIENERIVLLPKQAKKHRLADWPGFGGKKLPVLTTAELCAPVTDYDRE